MLVRLAMQRHGGCRRLSSRLPTPRPRHSRARARPRTADKHGSPGRSRLVSHAPALQVHQLPNSTTAGGLVDAVARAREVRSSKSRVIRRRGGRRCQSPSRPWSARDRLEAARLERGAQKLVIGHRAPRVAVGLLGVDREDAKDPSGTRASAPVPERRPRGARLARGPRAARRGPVGAPARRGRRP